MDFTFASDENGDTYLNVSLYGPALLSNALLNKGMAFPDDERAAFKLHGLLPPQHTDLTIQMKRSYETFISKASEIEKYIYLRDLQDSNETLFYALLSQHLIEMMPIVYTPVVGLGCQRYSHIYRRPRGIYISYEDQDRMDEILSADHLDLVKVIVVSDGERILGLGDQGAGGMGIPVGKLALYTACAGIHPVKTLPILLDTGTNNQNLLSDPLYIGWHHPRIRGKEYDVFIEKFVRAVKNRFPNVLLQWEDFAKQNAQPILEKYRDQLCTFNDDIQGTAAVAVAAILSAINITQSTLKDQRIVVVGAGSAGFGISQLIMQAMMAEGLTEREARRRFYLLDRNGLVMDDADLLPFQEIFARPVDEIKKWERRSVKQTTLFDVIVNVKPTILIGVSGQANIFTEEAIREMTKYVAQPIIFPLSNPTVNSEAHPANLLAWSNGKALIGTGSPFGVVEFDGNQIMIDQTNNCYIFPGLGLGLSCMNASYVTDSMFLVAAKALANCALKWKTNPHQLLPPLSEIKAVSLEVAIAVANEVIRCDLHGIKPPDDLKTFIAAQMWVPVYAPYRFKSM